MSNCKYETSNGRCGLKGCYAYRRKCYTEDMCRCHEPKTNADHIRSMTDDELAAGCANFVNEILAQNGMCDEFTLHPDFTATVLDHLKQPYKEGE